MTMRAALDELMRGWRELDRAITEDALWSATHMQVVKNHSFARRYVDRITELEGKVASALKSCEKCRRRRTTAADACRTFAVCQQHYNSLIARYVGQFMQFEAVQRLRRFGRQGHGNWRPWADNVEKALIRLRTPLLALGRALTKCWQEVADRVGESTVSVRAMNVGQEVKVGERMS
jgi:hypothetical protein